MTMTYVNSDSPATDGSAQPSLSHEEPVLSIELHTAASPVTIPTIRTVAADLAARADFDLDSIDDLRMAVDDACAMLVRIAAVNTTLSCRFTVWAERIELAAEVEADSSADPLPIGSFGWRVLESLADEVNGLFLPPVPNPDVSSLDQPSPLTQGERGRVRIALAKGALTAPPP